MVKELTKELIKEGTLFIICSAVIFSCGFFLGVYGYYNYENHGNNYFPTGHLAKYVNNITSEQDIIDSCSHLNLEDTAYCLKGEVSTIFNYTIRDETKYKGADGTFKDLLQKGGDCYDWNTLYVNLAGKLGFNSKPVSIYFNVTQINQDNSTYQEQQGHRIALIYSEEGYCKLDQLSEPDCFFFDIPKNLSIGGISKE